ncbi:MAG: DUF2461 domain-containing protein [Marinifilaceae bacterium]
MIKESIYHFLLQLRENNNREWFQTNKHLYNEAKKDFEEFIELQIEQTRQIDPDLAGLRAKDCLFRIFRDVRFSPDKRPYKTNFGAYLAKGGRKSSLAGYYIHIEPEQSFLGGGVYMPTSPVLKAIRKEIYQSPETFKEILNNKDFNHHYPEIWGEKLKTAPRGYPKDWPNLDLIRHKHYAVVKAVSDEQVLNNDFSKLIQQSFTALHPFNNYLNHIISPDQ